MAADVLILGGGPAGTSAALACAERGLSVALLDAGTQRIQLPPEGTHAGLRHGDTAQWRWQLGQGLGTPVGAGDSPKLRVPGFQSIFEGYLDANRIVARDFQAVGALAAGGLSNVWGCGVARFQAGELGALAAVRTDLDASVDRVARRIGLSGAGQDALSGYLGLDGVADDPIPLDAPHAALWARAGKASGRDAEFRIGRARVAVLAHGRDGRQGCDLRGMCLWGCARRSTWSAAFDFDRLQRTPGVTVETGMLATALAREGDDWTVIASSGGETVVRRAKRVLLAMGTLASTRLALSALEHPPDKLRLLSNPIAAFLLLLPGQLGRGHESGFGLAQLSYELAGVAAGQSAFGNLFSTAGLPVNEFLAHLPLRRRAGLRLLRTMLPAAVVGNVFLPGSLSDNVVRLRSDGSLLVEGGVDPSLRAIHAQIARRLQRAFRAMGAWMLPGAYVPGAAGADIHYAGTMPASADPLPHQSGLDGQIAGLRGVYAIDGACLPVLPAKAHTLTIMANADRIARRLPTGADAR